MSVSEGESIYKPSILLDIWHRVGVGITSRSNPNLAVLSVLNFVLSFPQFNHVYVRKLLKLNE